mmetsp:Transcript_21943/g.52449  ORF Transcript_21943/g.52449 Transcript_21943/m.52449 type:complete len:81 (+) Transcript_21943:120-362(+)
MSSCFENLLSETCSKLPGELNGSPFTLSGLEGCTVTLLDYTSNVEVANCSNCSILIGSSCSSSSHALCLRITVVFLISCS